MSAPVLDAPDTLSRLIPSRVARGFFLAVVSGIFFNFLNGSVKELAGEMPPLFVAWGRWVAGVLLIAPYLFWRGGLAGMRTRDMKLHCFRGLFHTTGYALWYEAVVWLPLAIAPLPLLVIAPFSFGWLASLYAFVTVFCFVLYSSSLPYDHASARFAMIAALVAFSDEGFYF